MSANYSIRDLLEKGEFVWSPCIYDCVSARVAEITGYNSILLSSCELEYGMNGIPAGLANWEEYIYAVERICTSSLLPLIVDGEDGGGTPMQVYRNCKRLAEAGAMAISIEDTCDGMAVDYLYRHQAKFMDAELFATNIAAAVDAVKGTDCMIIARTNCKGGGAAQTGAMAKGAGLGLDEAIRRVKMGAEAGAEITMIQNICHEGCKDECLRIAREVPGYRFYPDLHATNGKTDATLEELQEWGFHLTSNHVAMKGATKGMLEYFKKNFENKNTVYSENDDFGLGHVFTPFKMEDWIANQARLSSQRR